MVLRDYQVSSVDAVWEDVSRGEDPILELPCGAGKTPIGAKLLQMIREWDGRALCVTHVAELAQQMVAKLSIVAPELNPSICSAGLGDRMASGSIVIGTIQTVVRRAKSLGHRDIVIIDEAHCVGTDPKSSYQKLIKELRVVNPRLRVIGLTATPYRLGQGHLANGKGIFSKVSYRVKIPDLIAKGYLVPVRGKDVGAVDLSQVKISSTGDFAEGALQEAFTPEVSSQVRDFVVKAITRKRAMVFGTGKAHALEIQKELIALGEAENHGRPQVVFGDTPKLERDRIVRDHKAGRFRTLVAVRCLTTGYDCPEVDLVALMTSTMSPNLFSQMIGRGMRPAPDKTDCLVLDYGANVSRHGPVDEIAPPREPGQKKGEAPTKVCKECREVNFAGRKTCKDCGAAFPLPDPVEKLDTRASDTPLLAGDIVRTDADFDVIAVEYRLHQKPGKPPVLRVIYQVDLHPDISEWIHIQSHIQWHQAKSRKWWKARSYLPFPRSVEQALQVARAGGLARPLKIKVQLGGQYPEVKETWLDAIPPINERLAQTLKGFANQGIRAEPVSVAELWSEGEPF
jgi:DNA repair protein RadD